MPLKEVFPYDISLGTVPAYVVEYFGGADSIRFQKITKTQWVMGGKERRPCVVTAVGKKAALVKIKKEVVRRCEHQNRRLFAKPAFQRRPLPNRK